MTDSSLQQRFHCAMQTLPLIAILRGISPAQAETVARTLYDEGFRVIEVPLNSPSPHESIRLIRRALPAEAVVGAGTVLGLDQVEAVRQAGGELVVMPHADTAIIRAAKAAGMLCVPGISTPTEAFAALWAGADSLKLFPAELITPQVLRAMRVVLPRTACMLPVGGITPADMEAYMQAGASGFGIGSALYRPGITLDSLRRNASLFVQAWQALGAPLVA